MKYLVFSDVHGNLPALENVLKNEPDIEGYLNIGDVVNYGPWSNECVDLIATFKNCYNILGNHEEYFNNGVCNVEHPLVQMFFNKTYPDFTKKEATSKYKNSLLFNEFELIHTLGEKRYIFRDTEVNLENNIILGHSHQQYIRYINNKLLINPGSIGQNRAFINVSNYVVWDIETNEFQMKSTTYNLKHLISEMKSKKYPQACVDYYQNKNIY
ncbi:metallophosphoesterase family protein [Oceanihabitans sp. 2_MG-2023]|uniref:metallophosphoesterase family protein n=1 Tax=Oceanihabitans sp. 2_MG-2023 TaxID=3062661 RepID=UPI0026E4282B|nr:metallophosphoesterase family protein [Oceanihabitans sp. 2_MG-2023]MDO6595878.1 metallophosphoesterase family protein [Oceanihabitans sp. 2_MG-2023]